MACQSSTGYLYNDLGNNAESLDQGTLRLEDIQNRAITLCDLVEFILDIVKMPIEQDCKYREV